MASVGDFVRLMRYDISTHVSAVLLNFRQFFTRTCATVTPTDAAKLAPGKAEKSPKQSGEYA